jgi:hypothetical protein
MDALQKSVAMARQKPMAGAEENRKKLRKVR